jgi:hypothetical protein
MRDNPLQLRPVGIHKAFTWRMGQPGTTILIIYQHSWTVEALCELQFMELAAWVVILAGGSCRPGMK